MLLVVDETGSRMGMRVYTVDGGFTGRVIGREIFEAEPEGIGLWTSGDGGYWVATAHAAAATEQGLTKMGLSPSTPYSWIETDTLQMLKHRVGDDDDALR